MRFLHVLPSLFLYSVTKGNLDALTFEMCVKAERPYDACLRISSLSLLYRKIFDGHIRELDCKVSDVFRQGLVQRVKYEARSIDIRDGKALEPSPFKKAIKYRPQSEVRMLFIPKEGARITGERLTVEIEDAKAVFTEVFKNYRHTK